MNQLEAMRIYLRVAELASFTCTADEMGLPKASVSGAVQQLESLLGTRLLQRTTRRVQITQDGQVFYERCKDLLADLDEMQGMFRVAPAELRGRLRIDMPLIMARDIVVPELPAFMQQYPNIEIELSSTDRLVDVIGEGFDCVVRVGKLGDSSLIARQLGHYRLINCASPAYLAQFGTPKTLDELKQHRLIHYVPTLGGRCPGFEYIAPNAGGESHLLSMPGALTVNNSEAYQAACLAGQGLIQAPEAPLRPLLEQGLLVEILPEFRARPLPVSLLYANRRHLPLRVQAFMRWLSDCLQPHLFAADGMTPAATKLSFNAT